MMRHFTAKFLLVILLLFLIVVCALFAFDAQASTGLVGAQALGTIAAAAIPSLVIAREKAASLCELYAPRDANYKAHKTGLAAAFDELGAAAREDERARMTAAAYDAATAAMIGAPHVEGEAPVVEDVVLSTDGGTDANGSPVADEQAAADVPTLVDEQAADETPANA